MRGPGDVVDHGEGGDHPDAGGHIRPSGGSPQQVGPLANVLTDSLSRPAPLVIRETGCLSGEDVDQGRVREREGAIGAGERGERGPRIRARSQYPGQVDAQTSDGPLHGGDEQVRLAREMVVDAGPGDPRGRADVINARRRVAARSEQGGCHLQERLPPRLEPQHRARAFPGRPRGH